MTAIVDFENFMKNARWGQPLHRGNLATDTISPVTEDCDPKALVLLPQMMKERQNEILRGHAPAPTLTPGLNLGGGGSSMVATPNLTLNNRAPSPPSNSSGDE